MNHIPTRKPPLRHSARYALVVPRRDHALLRGIVQRLAEEGPEAERLRNALVDALYEPEATAHTGGDILKAFEPLRGAEIDFTAYRKEEA